MTASRTWSWVWSGALIAVLCSHPAHADYFSIWVAATCDSGSNTAAVRFGYADAEDAPLFMHADPSIDHGLTAKSASKPSQREASCSLLSGREVKVRIGSGYSDQGDQYSVWVDKIKVAHGEIDIDADNRNRITIPFAVIVYPNEFRTCQFQLTPRDLYDVTSAGAHSQAPPIHCSAVLSPVKGNRDLTEYPLAKTVRPQAGSIIVSGAEARLCRRMVVQVADIDPGTLDVGDYKNSSDDAIFGQRLGTTLQLYEFESIGRLPESGDPVASVAVTTIDMFGNGHPVPVYGISSGGSYPEEFLVVPPMGVSRADVMTMAGGMQFEDIEEAARQRGWRVFSGAQTPFNPTLGLEVDLIRAGRETYLLWYPPRGGDHMAVLVRPLPTGRVDPMCSFNRIAPQF